MAKASLVIMAAGIGSRFGGGIKQLEPVGPNGEIIMDYSIYDALEAGWKYHPENYRAGALEYQQINGYNDMETLWIIKEEIK